MFENDGHIYVYSPGIGKDNPYWVFFFSYKHKPLVFLIICCISSISESSMTFEQFSPSKCMGDQDFCLK